MSIPAEHLERMQGQVIDKQEPDKQEPDVNERLAALEAENTVLKDQNTKAQTALLKLIETPEEPEKPAAPAEPVKEIDWDNMSTKEIVQVVLGEAQKGQKAVAGALMTEVNKVKLQLQIERAAEKADDFFEYADEIVAIHKEKQGTVTPEEAYILAKQRRVNKAAADKTEAEKKAVTTGAKPGSSGAKPAPPPKSMRDAAKSTYAEIFGGKR